MMTHKILFLILFLPGMLNAFDRFVLVFDFNPAHEGITNYVVLIGDNPSNFTQSVSIGLTNRTTIRMPGVIPNPGEYLPSFEVSMSAPIYWISAQAQNMAGTSGPAIPIAFTNRPAPPKGLRIEQVDGMELSMVFGDVPARYVIYSSEDLLEWEPVSFTQTYRPDLWAREIVWKIQPSGRNRFYTLSTY